MKRHVAQWKGFISSNNVNEKAIDKTLNTYLKIPDEELLLAMEMGAIREHDSGRYFIPEGADLGLFSMWIHSAPLKTETASYISLTELLTRVDRTIAQEIANFLWVRLEVSLLEKKKNGYISLNVVDRDQIGTALSKSRAYISASQANQIEEKFYSETGRHLSEGMKLLVLVRVKFHVQYGLSLEITDIEPKFTLGDMEAKLRRIRESLSKLGEASMNIDLPPPKDIVNVAVISPAGSASLGDFSIEADKLVVAGLCRFRYFHALFQGPAAKSSLRDAFKNVHLSHATEQFDVLVLIRGGGAIDDLHWLNEEILARLVCRISIPVFAGIGHEKDTTILDECANRSFGTPSKVIGHLRDLIFTRASKAWEDWTEIQRKTSHSVVIAEGYIDQVLSEFKSSACRILDDAVNRSASSLLDIRSRSGRLETFAEGRINLLCNILTENARASVALAESSAFDLISNVNDRSTVAISSFYLRIENEFASIGLASRRSIDGLDKHIDNLSEEVAASSLTLANNATNNSARFAEEIRKGARRTLVEVTRTSDGDFSAILLKSRSAFDLASDGVERYSAEVRRSVLRATSLANDSADFVFRDFWLSGLRFLNDEESEVCRNFKDLSYYATRCVNLAEGSFKDMMLGIAAMGVDPTLKRGFTMIYAEGKPVTTRQEAERHHILEILFKDGKMEVKNEHK